MEMISETTLTRLRMLSARTRELDKVYKGINKDERVNLALMFSVTFKEFTEFAYVGMRFLGFSLTEMQQDIAMFMQYGPKRSGIMAQRGEAKSTLAALYCIWNLIHDQRYRVLIISGGEKQASEVAVLVIRLIESWHLLCWLRADASRGDRTSYEGYDVHCDLKPLDKSPSIACVGVTASLNGKRADLLLADDIETTKNGLSPVERERLLAISRDFSAICTHGEIMYLGTPQSRNSVYNTLESRGFLVQIWCGRIPSLEMEARYGDRLAPYIKELINRGFPRTGFGADGTLGASTDTGRYSEEDLVGKELDFGPEGFQLQYMLDTTMADALRTRIKLSDLIIYGGTHENAPDVFTWAADRGNQYPEIPDSVRGAFLYSPSYTGTTPVRYSQKVMIVDPAGCGGDELSYAVGGSASSYIHLFSVGGFQGGVSTDNIDACLELCIEMDVSLIQIESNMGHGTVSALFINRMRERDIFGIGVEDVFNTQQKERRIIDVISPVTRRHRLIVHIRALEDDARCCAAYSRDRRGLYSAFKQLQDITYDRGCLAKDDRADSIAMLVAKLAAALVVDEKEVAEKEKAAEFKKFYENPFDKPEFVSIGSTVGSFRQYLNKKEVKRNMRRAQSIKKRGK